MIFRSPQWPQSGENRRCIVCVFFKKKKIRTDDISSTPSAVFFLKKKPNHAALIKWANMVGLACQTQHRFTFFSSSFLFQLMFFIYFLKKNLIIFTLIPLLYFILYREPFLIDGDFFVKHLIFDEVFFIHLWFFIYLFIDELYFLKINNNYFWK